jgi:phytanoyl-CoA hydroxylase
MSTTFDEAILSNATLAQYSSDGYIAMPSLIGAAEVEAARQALTSVMLAMLADVEADRADYKPPVAGGTGNYDGAWIKLPGKKTALLFEHSFDPLAVAPTEAINHVRNLYYYDSEHPLFGKLVESPRIKGIAQQLLGEEAVMFQTMALVKPALIGSEKPWHQDNAYFKYAPLDKVVGFWMALDDAGRDNGCMHVLPGWHRRGGLKHFHAGDCQIMPDRIEKAAVIPVELKAGGAMFFSGMLPHQTPPNRSPKTRRALQFHYRGASTQTVDQAEYNRLFAEPDGTPASCEAAR